MTNHDDFNLVNIDDVPEDVKTRLTAKFDQYKAEYDDVMKNEPGKIFVIVIKNEFKFSLSMFGSIDLARDVLSKILEHTGNDFPAGTTLAIEPYMVNQPYWHGEKYVPLLDKIFNKKDMVVL